MIWRLPPILGNLQMGLSENGGYTGMHAKGLYLSGELMINFHKPLKRGIPVYPQMANIYWQNW